MSYRVEFTPKAKENIKKIEKTGNKYDLKK
jgi:mRNA-degrading endonuclease RelE of RelBE toxin-antitoxin system